MSAFAAAATLGCSRDAPGPGSPAPKGPPRVVWQYEVRGEGGAANDLAVEAQFAPGSTDEIRADDDGAPYVHDVAFWSAPRGDWAPAPAHGSTWSVPCRAEGCRVRYRFALREAAVRLDDPGTAIASGDVFVAPPSTWLLRPDPEVAGERFRFHVALPPPALFAAGTHPAPIAQADTYEADTDSLDGASFAAFGPFHLETLREGAARVDVAVAPHRLALSNADVVAWVRSAVGAIASYYGRFPVERTLVVFQAGRPDAPTRG